MDFSQPIIVVAPATAEAARSAWEQIPDLASIFTALMAVWIAWRALKTSQQQQADQQHHNRLSCRPHLTTWKHSNSDEARFVVILSNNGIGPAVIKSFKLFYKGKLLQGSPEEATDTYVNEVLPALLNTQETGYVNPGHVIAVGEKITLLDIAYHDPENESLEKVHGIIEDSRIEIEYESFCEDTFIYDSDKHKN